MATMHKKTLNEFTIIGFVGAAPAVSSLPNGTLVAELRVATTEKKRSEDETEWHTLVGYGSTAEQIQRTITKGDWIWAECRLKPIKNGVRIRINEIAKLTREKASVSERSPGEFARQISPENDLPDVDDPPF